MNDEFVTPDRRPTAVGSAVALAFVLAGVAALTDDATELVPVAIEAACLLCVGGGRVLQGRGRSRTGRAAVFVGSLAQFLAVGAAASMPERLDEQVVLVVGLFGVALCLLGLYPLRRSQSRQFVNAGVGACLVSILVAGVLREASVLRLTVASAATLVGWNVGQQAVTLGRRVGRAAGTKRVEAVRTLANASVGAILVASVAVGNAVAPIQVPTLALTLFLATVIALLTSLLSLS
ncbi:hypothetical protein M0R89_06000 [Halorussus limi]|uniref:Uncharacterized protein n=1 Tax=Halorussus limi TaxID=2938695 RepID=A0A8U0HYM6_9EURY|nr:hypothetical protein [Halorussus limi]UPV75614.1 hypothetical protein M0R89_06000 [Halorussus limi]